MTGNQLFICHAEDTIRGRPLNGREKVALAMRSTNKKSRQELPAMVELAIGMKVMVTTNVETDLDITNGARGTIMDIILHPDESYSEEGRDIVLKNIPLYLLVKLERTRATPLKGLDEAVIPVELATKSMQVQVVENDGNQPRRTVKRCQFPVTAAYAFTDYRLQGQTIPYVVVDIATPPTGGLSLFNLYVALSRSSGKSTIRLLRDFDAKVFQASHSSQLLAEDDRLKELNIETKEQWERNGRGRQRN